MSDSGYHQPAYLGRLHMRVSSQAHKQSMKGEKLSNSALRTLYQDPRAMRSKYKGKQAEVSSPSTFFSSSPSLFSNSSGFSLNFGDGFSSSSSSSKDEMTSQSGHTSGIPIFGEDDSSPRTGWSVGHTFQRSTVKQKLKALASKRNIRKHMVAENSHALGHGDYGVDHLLSAPAASKAQNTEQLAIELGMREAAQKLNAQHGLGKEASLVHAKISDVIHPKTGQLLARRFKLIRRANADDTEGKVVFDHLMDGQRLHISKRETMALGSHVHDALMDDGSLSGSSYRPVSPHSMDDRAGPRGGIGGIKAPTRTALRQHQANVLYALQQKRRGVSVRDRYLLKDRKGVPMVGPAFTKVSFPAEQPFGQRPTYSGQRALVEARKRAQKAYSGAPVDTDFVFHHSGSVPSDADSLMHAGMQSLRARLKHTFGSARPSRARLSRTPLRARMGISAAYNKVANSGGDRSLLEGHERQLLRHLREMHRQSQAAPRGKIIQQFDLSSIDDELLSSSSSQSTSSSARRKRSHSDGPGAQALPEEDSYEEASEVEEADMEEQTIEKSRKRRKKNSDGPSVFSNVVNSFDDEW